MDKVTRNTSNTYAIATRIGPATVSDIVPTEDRTTTQVVRWACRLTLSHGGTTYAEDFEIVPDAPFKPLAAYTKLDLQGVLEKLANSPEIELYMGRFEKVHAHVPNKSFVVGQLAD